MKTCKNVLTLCLCGQICDEKYKTIITMVCMCLHVHIAVCAQLVCEIVRAFQF